MFYFIHTDTQENIKGSCICTIAQTGEYTSYGALAGTKNSSMGPLDGIDTMTMSGHSTTALCPEVQSSRPHPRRVLIHVVPKLGSGT